MTRAVIIIFAALSVLFVDIAVAPTQLYAKKNKSSSKSQSKKSQKSKKKVVKSKQSVDKSLELLDKYYYNAQTSEEDPSVSLLSHFTEIESSNEFSDFSGSSVFDDSKMQSVLLETISAWLGTPYRRGGRSFNGVDCSNFTSSIIESVLNIPFPSSPSAQAELFTPIKSINDLKFGDLIFFTGRNKKSNRIGHVGIYIANGLFVHSTSGRGVIYTHISEGYYSARFRFGGRLQKNSFAHL